MNLEDLFHSFSDLDFEKHALALFQYQYEKNAVYRSFCDMLKIKIEKITSLQQIPFLPISFFKTHSVKTGNFEPEIEFWSSGTTGNETSKHFVKEVSLYERSFLNTFEYFYGNPQDYCFLALLPNYLEQKHSSLIYMMNQLISGSKYAESGFYLYNYEELYKKMITLQEKRIKTILFGVSFALLDFAEKFKSVSSMRGEVCGEWYAVNGVDVVDKYTCENPELMVFETGGMKGRRPEIVKEELHKILCNAFGVKKIHSEYGMCELLSQAYSNGDNLFVSPPWMRLLLRDEKDPLYCNPSLNTGVINVIDFANIHSCAFIATDDLGKKTTNGMIEILGRLDAAQIRGCNLMYW
ncbi:MAG: acyl transferase [Bacteroidetes bacterium]|nr:acyl transferase [Bacteroidota bacterium]MCL1969398.1 acyl transferase [Bacteroidota bacterium]